MTESKTRSTTKCRQGISGHFFCKQQGISQMDANTTDPSKSNCEDDCCSQESSINQKDQEMLEDECHDCDCCDKDLKNNLTKEAISNNTVRDDCCKSETCTSSLQKSNIEMQHCEKSCCDTTKDFGREGCLDQDSECQDECCKDDHSQLIVKNAKVLCPSYFTLIKAQKDTQSSTASTFSWNLKSVIEDWWYQSKGYTKPNEDEQSSIKLKEINKVGTKVCLQYSS